MIHPHTVVGAGTVVGDHAVLGKPPRLRVGSAAATGERLTGLVIGEDDRRAPAPWSTPPPGWATAPSSATRRSSASATVGADTVVGRGSTVDCDVTVGDHVSIQTDVYVTARSVVEDDVFLGPGVLTTNDDRMGRPVRGADGEPDPAGSPGGRDDPPWRPDRRPRGPRPRVQVGADALRPAPS